MDKKYARLYLCKNTYNKLNNTEDKQKIKKNNSSILNMFTEHQ